MEEYVLTGRDGDILKIPQTKWVAHLAYIPQHGRSRLGFMTRAHHQVRYFVVKEMVNTQKPIEPEYISERLNMPLALVEQILLELERNLFFLVRNDQGAVAWAYPVTVQVTPHKLAFQSGERLYAA